VVWVIIIIILVMRVVSSLVGEHSSNMPYGLKVTLNCPMRKTLGQIGNQGSSRIEWVVVSEDSY